MNQQHNKAGGTLSFEQRYCPTIGHNVVLEQRTIESTQPRRQTVTCLYQNVCKQAEHCHRNDLSSGKA